MKPKEFTDYLNSQIPSYEMELLENLPKNWYRERIYWGDFLDYRHSLNPTPKPIYVTRLRKK